MIDGGRGELGKSPFISLIPAGVMFLTVLSLNLIGDRFRRRFDVREGAL
jgi:peptide/nickel transport system permease protein